MFIYLYFSATQWFSFRSILSTQKYLLFILQIAWNLYLPIVLLKHCNLYALLTLSIRYMRAFMLLCFNNKVYIDFNFKSLSFKFKFKLKSISHKWNSISHKWNSISHIWKSISQNWKSISHNLNLISHDWISILQRWNSISYKWKSILQKLTYL